jgi:hypothetical protein
MIRPIKKLMRTTIAFATAWAMLSSVAAAQAPLVPARTGTSPVASETATTAKMLSTVPTPPPGAVSRPTQMSGMPRQVGDLPPGTVAVRVVRDPFENVPSQFVVLHRGSVARAGTTGDDGRATFAGLAVGDEVYASAVVDGEALESARFRLPPDGGVRVLLVAGTGVTGPADPALAEVFGATPAAAIVPTLTAAVPASTGKASEAALRVTALAILATAAVLFALFSRGTGPRAAAPDDRGRDLGGEGTPPIGHPGRAGRHGD